MVESAIGNPGDHGEKLMQLRDRDPDSYREIFHTLLPVDALPSDALSDRQLEVICDAMVKGLARLARRNRGSIHSDFRNYRKSNSYHRG